MKIWKIICLILGIIFSLLGLIGVFQMDLAKEGETAYKIGYILGSLISFLPAALFFFIVYRLNKKIKQKELHKMTDSFLTSNHESV